MMELIKDAWLGWQNYTDSGKFAALLLVLLLIIWFAGERFREHRERYYVLFIYTTVMAVCCICPLTAAVLMNYQTRFYHYQWIWNLVPVTIAIALAGTLLWEASVEKFAKQKGRVWKCIGITLALVFIVYLSGSMGNTIWDTDEEAVKRQETAEVLYILTEGDAVEDVNLWAPRGIMEYARALDGNVRLPYGRNMWDLTLNAYSYDVYGEDENTLYAWMSNVEETGEGEVTIKEEASKRTVTGSDCIDIAKALGVTHVLLPENVQPDVMVELEEYSDTQAEILGGYYLLRIR